MTAISSTLPTIPPGATIIDPIKQALITKLVSTATQQGGAALGEFVAASAPTIIDMGIAELSALSDALANKNTSAALAQIASSASLDQLAAQKTTLADLTRKMAQSNADAALFWQNFVYRGLTLGLSALVLL